jgi:hypothetical protein
MCALWWFQLNPSISLTLYFLVWCGSIQLSNAPLNLCYTERRCLEIGLSDGKDVEKCFDSNLFHWFSFWQLLFVVCRFPDFLMLLYGPILFRICQGIHWACLCQGTHMFTLPFSQLMRVVIVDVSVDGVAAATSTVKASRRTETLDASHMFVLLASSSQRGYIFVFLIIIFCWDETGDHGET